MLNKLLTFVLFLMPIVLIGQINNTDKGAAIIYTKGAPTGAVRIKYDSEWAIDVNTSKVYRYDRTNSAWILAGSNIGYLNSTSAPTGAPKYGGPEFIINNDKELYWYYAGSWQCLNCGIIPYVGGTGINVTGNTITNTAPDQTVVLSNGIGISVTGTYPNFTITNTAPDQTVTITGAGISNVTGTYPNFTITSTELDGSITNEIQAIDSLMLSGDTLIVSLGSDGVPASRVILSGLTASSGGGIYGQSDTVTYNHLAVIDSGLTFSTTEDTGYFNIITAPGVYGSTAYFHPDSIRLRHYDIGGSNELILHDDGVLIKTNSPDRLIIQGNDARYFADYRATYSARSFIDKQYGDDFYLQNVDTFRVSNDTLYISLARDSVPQSFVVLPSSGSSGIDLYELDIITPLPGVDVEGSMVLKTVDINGSKFLYVSNGTDWVDAGLFLDTLNVATIHLGDDQVTYAKIQEVTAERLLGNPTGSTTNPSEIPLGTGLGFSAGSLINTSPDQTVVLNSGTGISVTGTYPTFTITNSSPNITTDLTFTGASSPYTLNSSDGTDVTFAQGSGITLSRSSNELTIAAVDQSTTNEIQRLDTFEIVSNSLRASLLNDGVPFSSVNLAPYLDNTDSQTLSVDSTDIGGVTERFEISISGGNTIYIDVPQVGGTGGGQNNVGANLGTGVGIYAGKTDTTLNFKSLVEGYGIDITATSTEITIKADTAQIATLYDVAVVQADINAHELADGDLDDENELQDIVLDSAIVGGLERFELSLNPAGNTVYFDIPQNTDDQTLTIDSASTTGGQNFTLDIEDGNSVSWFVPDGSAMAAGDEFEIQYNDGSNGFAAAPEFRIVPDLTIDWVENSPHIGAIEVPNIVLSNGVITTAFDSGNDILIQPDTARSIKIKAGQITGGNTSGSIEIENNSASSYIGIYNNNNQAEFVAPNFTLFSNNDLGYIQIDHKEQAFSYIGDMTSANFGSRVYVDQDSIVVGDHGSDFSSAYLLVKMDGNYGGSAMIHAGNAVENSGEAYVKAMYDDGNGDNSVKIFASDSVVTTGLYIHNHFGETAYSYNPVYPNAYVEQNAEMFVANMANYNSTTYGRLYADTLGSAIIYNSFEGDVSYIGFEPGTTSGLMIGLYGTTATLGQTLVADASGHFFFGDVDLDDENELQDLVLDSTIVGDIERFELSISPAGNTVYFDVPQNTDAQNLTIEGSGPTYDIAISGGTDVTLSGGGIVTLSESPANTLVITATEVDGSVSNEGSLTVAAGTSTTSVINSNTSGQTGVTLEAAGILTISETGNTITLTGTEVDGSTTNEIQDLSLTGSGPYTIDLSSTSNDIVVSAGTGISLSESPANTLVITNSAPDQTVTLNSGTGISVSGTYPTFTITNSSPNVTTDLTLSGTGPYTLNSSDGTDVTFTQGTGMTLTRSSNDLTITNAAPDQTVVLNEGTGIDVTGTYPNFTITNTVTNTDAQNLTIEGAGPTYDIAISGGSDVTIQGGGIVTLSESPANTLIITATEVDGSTTNEIQNVSYTASTRAVAISGGGTGFTFPTFSTSGTDAGLVAGSNGATTNFLRGDNTWQAVITTEVDGSTSNELQDLSITGASSPFTLDISGSSNDVNFASGTGISLSESPANTLVITNSAPDQTVTLTEGSNVTITGTYPNFTISATPGAGVTDLTFTGSSSPYTLNSSTGTDVTFAEGSGISLSRSSNELTITATDASVTNEAWTVDADGGDTEVISNQTLLFAGAGIASTSYNSTSNTLTITATEVDGSTSNELQTIANTSDATSHTVTLSNSGGTIQFIEGTNISLTTGGTSGAGTLTIASSVTDTDDQGLTIGGSGPTYTIDIDGGSSVTIAAAGITTLSESPANTLVITSTEVDGSVSNEGSLTVAAGSSTTSIINSNTSGQTGVTIEAAGILTISESGNTITITGTEVDGSVSNELQTYGHAGTTTYTNTLSNGGGSWSITGAGIAAISQTGGAITVTATEVDGSTTNEIQQIDTFSINAAIISASLSSDGVPAKTLDITESVQDLVGGMVTGNTETGITVTYEDSDGTLDFVAADVSPTNEIQRLDTFEIVSNILRASLLNDGVPFSSVDLSSYLDNTDDQTLSIDSSITTDGQNFILEIEDGNSVSWFVPSVGQTIYKASSSLISDRVVSLDGYTLTFEHVDGARSSTIYQDSTQVINQVVTEDGEIIQSITNYQEGANATKQYLLDIDHPGTSTEVQIIAGYDNGDAEMSLTVTQGVSISSLFLDTVGVKINTIGGTGTNGQILYSDGDYAYWDDLNITSADVITLADSVALKAYTGVATAVILKQQGREGMFVRTTTSRAHDGYMVFTDGNGNKWKRVVEEATLNVKWFGAIGNGVADDYYAIQRAIDYTIYEDTTIKQVFLPSGNYLISRTLHLGYGSAYSSVTLIGDGTPTFRGEQQYNGATITVNFSNAPAINIQGARYTSIKNLTLIGLNDIAGFLYDTSSANINNWIDAGLDTIGDNRRTPYAGITIDGYSGTAPTPAYPNVSYPSYTGIGTQYNKIFSSQIKIENVGIHGFIAGVVLQPNSDGNGDFVQIEKCIIDRVAYGISVGNANSRNFAIRDCYIDAHTGLTNSTHGNQTGRFTLIENVHFGGYQWFDINAIAYLEGFEITNCYGESFYWLGTFDGIAGNQPSIKFTSCDFSQTSVGNRNLSNFGKLGGYGSFIFENCSFKGNRIYTFNNADGSWLTFNQCKFTGIAYEGETGDSIEIYHERYFRSFLFLMAAYPDRVRVNQCRFHDTDDITTLSMPQTDGNGITFPDDMEYVTYWKNRDNTGIDINFQDLGHPGYLGISSAFNSYGFTNRLFEGEVKSTYNQGIGPGDLLLFKTDEVLLPVMVTDIDGQDVTGLLMSNYKYNSNGDFTNAFESLTLTSSNVLHISSRKFLNTRTITGDFTSGSRIVTNVRYPYDGTNPANSFEIYTPLLNMNGQLNAAPSPVTTTTYIDSIISSSSFRLSENAARTGTYTIQNCFLGVTDDRTQYLADKEIAFGTGYGIDSDPSFLYDDDTDRMAMGTTDFNRQINLRGGSAAGGILMDTDGTADDDVDPNGVIQFKSVADGGYTQFGTIGFDGFSNSGTSPKGQSLTFKLTTTGQSSAGYTVLYENQLLVNNSSSFTFANNSGRLRIQAGTGGVFSTDTPWLLGGSAYTTVDNNVRLKLAGDNSDTTSSEYGLRVYNGFNQPYFSARNDGNIIIGGRTVSSKLIFLEPTGSGSNFTSIRSGAQSSNYEYIWPIDNPSDGQVLSWNTGGQLSWEDAGGADVNIYEDDGNVQDGGTIVDVSGNDPIIFNLDASSTEVNRMTRYYVDLTGDDLFTYFAQYVTPNDSLYITSFDSGIYLNYQGTTASGEGFVISSNTILDLRGDSILMSTVPSKTVLHYITGMYGNTHTKIEGTADGQILVWDETNGYWEIGAGVTDINIYDDDGNVQDGGTIVDVSGNDPIILALDNAGGEINRMLRMTADYAADDAVTYYLVAATGSDSLQLISFDDGMYLQWEGITGTGEGFVISSNTMLNLQADSILMSTVPSKTVLHYITGQYGNTHTKIEGTANGDMLVWDETNGYWEIGTGGGGGNGIYGGDGTLQTGTTNAVLPANAEFRVDYDGGNPALSVNDALNQTYISGQDGTYSVYADNSNAGLVHGAGSWLTGSAYSLVGTASVSNTNTANDRLVIQTNSSGTAAANFGGGILFQGESSTTDDRDMVRLSAIWTTATDASRASALVYSDVTSGGTLTERFRFTPSAMTTSTNYTIGNSSSITTVGGGSGQAILGGSTGVATLTSSGSTGITIQSTQNTGSSTANITFGNGTSFTQTSGTRNYIEYNWGFAPTSGTAVHNQLAFIGTFNQTGGANGITRGIYLNQTLTAVADFRAIEIAANEADAKGIYQTGSSTTNNFVGNTSFGTTSAPNASALIDIVSTTKGFGTPVMTTAQRDAISSPREGLVVYSSDNDALNLRDGASVWKRLPTTQTILKTADETVNNSSTYQADDALTFTAKANKKYVGKIKIFITAANWDVTAGFKGKITASGATTVRYGGNGGLVYVGGQVTYGYSSDDSVDIIINDAGFYDGDYAVLDLYFYINPGAGDRTVQFEWAQYGAHTSDLKVLEGSFLEYEEIN